MALTDRHRAAIVQAVELVFCRAPFALVAPFENRQAAAAYWYSSYPSEAVDAYRLLERYGARVADFSRREYEIEHPDAITVTVRMGALPEPGKEWLGVLNQGRGKVPCVPEWFERAGTTLQAFNEWVTLVSTLDRDIVSARVVLRDVVEIAKTGGQLARMVPDLLQYLPNEVRNELAVQQRASQLPDKWTGYDRQSVYKMTETIARCYLLPPIDRVGHLRGTVDYAAHAGNRCWAQHIEARSQLINTVRGRKWAR